MQNRDKTEQLWHKYGRVFKRLEGRDGDADETNKERTKKLPEKMKRPSMTSARSITDTYFPVTPTPDLDG